MPYNYRQVSDLYRSLHDAGVVSRPLPDWSSEMNRLTQSHLYDQGLNDNLLKQASTGIDRAIDWTGLPKVTEGFGRDVGSMFGAPDVGASIGENLPRMTANFLPVAAASALAPEVTIPALLATAGLSGAETYTNTGSPAAGIVTGATNAIMPGVAGLAERATLRGLGAKALSGPVADALGNVTGQAQQFFPTATQSVASFLAGQGAAATLGEGSSMLQAGLDPNGQYNFSPTSALLNMTLGQLPFAAAHLAGKAFGKSAPTYDELKKVLDYSQGRIAAKEQRDAFLAKSPIENVPDVIPTPDPVNDAKINQLLANIRGEKEALVAKGIPNDVPKIDELSRQEDEVMSQSSGDGVMGETLAPESDRFDVAGTQHFYNPETGYRIVKLNEDPANTAQGFTPGQLIGYSTKFEPRPQALPMRPDVSRYSIPKRFHNPDVIDNRAVLDAVKLKEHVETNPDLPFNPKGQTFTTSKGSTYIVNSDGTTTRNKSIHVEHPGDEGVKPKSDSTFYVTKEQANLLSEVQSQGIGKKTLRQLPDGSWGLYYLDGPSQGKFERRTVVEPKKQPEVGLVPVELWNDSSQPHFGNEIVSVKSNNDGLDRIREQAADFNDVKTKLEAVGDGDTEGFRKAIEAVNGVRQKWGYEPLTDKDIAKQQQWVGAKTSTDVVKGKVNDLMSRIAQREVLAKQREQVKAEPVTVDPTEVAAKANVPETDHVRAIRQSVAEEVTDHVFHLTGPQSFDEQGRPERGDQVSDLESDAREFRSAFADGSLFSDPAYREMLKSDHVKEWVADARGELTRLGQHEPIANAVLQAESKGFNFMKDFVPYDPTTNKLGKHPLPKNGVIREAAFKNMGGEGVLSDIAIKLGKELVPEAFSDGNVNVPVLMKGLKEKGPVVEVKKLGGREALENERRYNELQHVVDTLNNENYNWFQDYNKALRNGNQQAIEQAKVNLVKAVGDARFKQLDDYISLPESDMPQQDTNVHYSFLGPKSEQEMPGYVEGLVRVPTKKVEIQKGKFSTQEQNKESGLKFVGPHFGSEDTNVLAFYRGYEETLPDGRKAFHVIEVQSDWGQANRKRQEQQDQPRFTEDAKNAPDHPLLSAYETLALKAVIQHAQSIGADAIILSDGETAMMTEGHDKQEQPVQRYSSAQEAEEYIANHPGSYLDHVGNRDFRVRYTKPQQPAQSAGMRLHYDTTLPSTLAKLTGEKGERWDGGVHKNSFGRNEEGYGDEFAFSRPVEGSSVFRNPDGSPKTNITGRIYDLGKAKAKIEAQGGHTLTSPSRVLGPGSDLVRPWEPQTEAEKARVTQFAPDSGGASILHDVLRTGDDTEKAIAKDLLENFPESLKRTTVRIVDADLEGMARSTGNREVDLLLSHGTLMNPDVVRRNQVMLHELIHGLTLAELDNPTKKPLFDELTKMRERLIDYLPERVRIHLNRLINSNYTERFANGQDPNMAELDGPNKEHQPWRQILYGLSNNKELVTQGMTDPRMKQFLQKLPAPGSRINAFYNWVKRMVGLGEKVTDNEFARLADITSRIMDQGNYISKLSNFTDQYYGSKGYTPAVIRDLSRRVLQVVQSSAPTAHKDIMLSGLMGEEPVNRAFAKAKREFGKMIQEDGSDAAQHKAIFGELEQPADGVDGLLADHLMNGNSDMATAMKMLPEATTNYMFERAKDLRDVLDGVRAATIDKNAGMLNINDPKAVRKPVADALASVNKFLKFQSEQEADRSSALRMQNVAPDAFFNSVQNGFSGVPKAIDEEVGKAVGAPVAGSSAWKWLAPMSQMARSDPRLGEYFSRLMLMPGKIRQMVSSSTKVLSRAIRPDGTLGPENNKETLDQMYKMVQNGPLRDAINKLIYKKQEVGGNAVRQLDYNSPEFNEIAKNLSPKDKNDLIAFDNKVRLSKVAADQVALDALRQDLSMRGAQLPMADEGMKLGPALDASTKLFDALNSNFQAPQEAAVANAQIASVQGKMQPQSFFNLLSFVKDSVEQHQMFATHLANNPDWVSAKRGGKYLYEYYKNGKVVAASGESMKEASAQAGGKDNVKNFRPNERSDDDFVDFGNATKDQLDKLRVLEERQFQSMAAAGATPELLATMRKMSPVAQAERDATVAGRPESVGTTGRTLSRGAEELPWFENHIDWFSRNANYWQRRLMRTTGESLASEPGTRDTDAATMIRQHLQQFMQKDPEVGRAIQKVASVWSLGFNLAGNIANATQTYMRGVGELIALGHGPLKALSEMNGAWLDLIGKRLEDKPFRSATEEKFMADAKHDGMLDPSMRDEEAAADELSSTRFKEAINKEKPKTLGQHLSSAAGAYTNAGMMLWKVGDYANNKAQLLATFRTLQKTHPELSYDELKKQAYLVNASVNDVGGRANRPIGPFAGKDQVSQTLGMTMMSLRSYSLGSTMQLIRLLKAGGFRPNGLTPAEVFSARKAAVYQLGVQFAAAGALGMPFASASLALLNQFFPELEVQKKLRESVSSLFGSDSDNGHILSDIALSGIPSMMGWDLASRLNAGNVLPGVSEYNGFQPEQLLGVPANLVGNFVRGGQKLASGDATGGYAFVPLAIKKIVQLAAQGGTEQDYRGRPVLSDLTPGEKIGIGIGFQPKRLTDFDTADRLAQQEEHLAVVRTGQENQQMAELALKGQFGTIRSQIQQKLQTDKSSNPADVVRAIARAAEEMSFPKDLRREGSQKDMDSRKQLLSAFSLDPSGISEVDRLKFRQQIQQRLGLTSIDRTELRRAQLMDAMRAKDPTSTRSELGAAATNALRRMQPDTLGLQ